MAHGNKQSLEGAKVQVFRISDISFVLFKIVYTINNTQKLCYLFSFYLKIVWGIIVSLLVCFSTYGYIFETYKKGKDFITNSDKEERKQLERLTYCLTEMQLLVDKQKKLEEHIQESINFYGR